ncbi:FAD-dependent oxidoreductase [Kribbella sp. NPDC056951]|uniref:FAD-dependent oxidoreductase n=1 Tax=Kribbella sp. NPDC056951 TaxID=3345978 RepID=UPI00363AFE0C
MRVGVIGGGIGGLCLAQGLRKAGIEVAVYERDRTPESRLQGFRLNIEPIGGTALHACLPPALWAVLVATAGDSGRGIGFLDEQMRSMILVGRDGEAPLDPLDPATGEHAVSRVTLRRLLLAGVQDVVHFGKEFTSFTSGPDGTVSAHFADGTRAEADVLVAADGANSRAWAQLHPEAGQIELPAVAVGGKLYLDEETLGWLPDTLLSGKNIFWPRRDFLFTAVFRRRENPESVVDRLGPELRALGLDPGRLLTESTDRDYVMWAYIAHRDSMPADFSRLPPEDAHATLAGRTKRWHPALHRLITSSYPDDLFQTAFTAARPLSLGPATNVTGLGDAVHHMPPVGGLGGNTALRDAQHLCAALTAVHSGQRELSDALTEYEQEMVKHGFATVRESVRNTEGAITRNRVVRTAARTFFRTCGAIPPLGRAVFAA